MPKRLIEAALFMAPGPLEVKEISRITGISSLGEIERMLHEISSEYEGKGIEVVNTPEGWAMKVKDEHLPKVAHLTRYSDLSNGHKRTLALVVYKEPIKQSEIIRIQGNKAYGYIKSLEKKGLIRSEKSGRTRSIMLTSEFENYFGEDKEKIRERVLAGVRHRKIPKEPELGVKKSGQADKDAFEKLIESKKEASDF